MSETEKIVTALKDGLWKETRLQGEDVNGELVLPSSLPIQGREKERDGDLDRTNNTQQEALNEDSRTKVQTPLSFIQCTLAFFHSCSISSHAYNL